MDNLTQPSTGPQGQQPSSKPWWRGLLPWLFILAFLVSIWFMPALLGQSGSASNEAVG